MMAAVRCSVAVREAGLDPAGTANNVLGYVLVEWPLPWDAKPERIAELRPVADRAADLGLRLQLVHEIEVGAEPHRVGIVDRVEGPFQSYRRRVWTLPESVEKAIASVDERRAAIAQQALAVLNDEAGDADAAAALPDILMCT